MVRKPEIQYVGQFYVHGSEARALEPKPAKKLAKTVLPKPKPIAGKTFYVEPVALVGIIVSIVMVVVLLVGVGQMKQCWQEYDAMSNYLAGLKTEHASLSYHYSTGYDLATVESTALAVGMVPRSELTVIQAELVIPQPEPEPTVWDEFVWFLSELFA